MIVLVTGGRDFTDEDQLYACLDRLDIGSLIECVVHGVARGADALAGRWASDTKGVKVMEFRANWADDGKAAGFIRNERMVAWCAAQAARGKEVVVLACPGGNGTAHCVRMAEAAGLEVRFLADLVPPTQGDQS